MNWDFESGQEQFMQALHRIWLKLEQILGVETEIRDLLLPRPNSLKVQFSGDTMSLAVGDSTTATVTVLDQNGQPMTYDFTTNAPQWTADANASLAPGPNPNDEVFTGVSAGTENWSVMVPGVMNPTIAGSFEVVAAAQVATSVVVVFNPAV